MESILTALISGGLTLLGVLIANSRAQAVTETKLDELTREVREHNHFARRMPVVEEQVKVINHRLEDLEAFHRYPPLPGHPLSRVHNPLPPSLREVARRAGGSVLSSGVHPLSHGIRRASSPTGRAKPLRET